MKEFGLLLLRALTIFVLLSILVRLMGRKQLSQMTLSEYITGIVIGSLCANLIMTPSQSLLNGSAPILFWGLIPVISSYLALKSLAVRKLTHPEPVIVIQNGNVLTKKMAELRYNVSDLLMQLREKNVFDPTEVEFAILEPNGKLSILKKSQHLPVTPKDLNIATPYRGLMTELILNGKVLTLHLRMINKDMEWLIGELKKKGIENIQTVAFAGLLSNGELYVIDEKNY